MDLVESCLTANHQPFVVRIREEEKNHTTSCPLYKSIKCFPSSVLLCRCDAGDVLLYDFLNITLGMFKTGCSPNTSKEETSCPLHILCQHISQHNAYVC